jgi:Cof subfamily protein (haloacid dehalogenase superfamily)
MKYKILCCDLDGTLLTTKSDVSDFTVSEIGRIRGKTRIILVSARMPQSMTYLQRRLGVEHEPLICYNGAYVLNGTEEISSTEIAVEQVADIYRVAREKDIKLGLYYKTEWYVEENTERVRKEIRYTRATPHFRKTEKTLTNWKNRRIGAHKIMLMGTKRTVEVIFPQLKERLGVELHLYRSNDTLIEIAPKSVSKLTAIRLLLKKDESLADVIAFGDNYNDIEMLEKCGYGVAVGNAREEVKAIADDIAPPNYENGVAHFIKDNLLE